MTITDSDDSRRIGEKWSDSGCIVKVEPMGFADRLDERYERLTGYEWQKIIQIPETLEDKMETHCNGGEW